LARYTDSDGFKADHSRPNIWRYRDYVGGDNGVQILRPQFATGELLTQKAIIGFVGIEGADQTWPDCWPI